jgi:hypothetical protein
MKTLLAFKAEARKQFASAVFLIKLINQVKLKVTSSQNQDNP